jgi:hypothetical protein
MQVSKHTTDRRVVISTIWIFYLFNILYADVIALIGGFDPSSAENTELINTLISPVMLLFAAIFLEMAMVMIVLSRFLKHGINRWANIIVATLHILGLIASLFVGTPTMYYIFFVSVEVPALLYIIWYAWTWKKSIE